MAKYDKYDKYKDSGVEWLGEIPSHWDVKRLGSFFEERREKVSDVDYPALSVTKSGIVPQLDTAAKTDAGDNRKLVKADDFVINSRSDRKGSSGISPYTGSVSLISIVMEPRTIYPAYAHHLLRSYPFQEEFYRYGKGIVADLWSTNSSEMKNILLPVIPITEQQNIANFLDHETTKIDSLIEKQQQLIQLLKEKRQAVISHAVTKGLDPSVKMKDSGVEWLGQVPEHWTVSKLKHFVNVVDCKHITAEFFDEGIPLASIGEVKGWKVNLSKAKLTNEKYYFELIDGNRKPQIGDIIYTRNATVGEAALVHEELSRFALGQDVCLIHIIQKLYPEFLLHFLKSEIIKIQLNSAMVGSTFKRINVDDIRNYVVIIPPFEEQKEILKALETNTKQYDSLIFSAEKQIDLMQERRTALISSAVTGKIDVRHCQNPNKNNNKSTEIRA